MDVKACSPPDKRERDCIFFSGGLANISNPDCNGSSEPMSFNSALPPLNNLVKILLKFSLTSSKLLRNLFLPSLFNSDIPSSNFLIVTHHRLTMAKMNNLLGVTMEEKGISKLLSVDLEKAVEIKEAS